MTQSDMMLYAMKVKSSQKNGTFVAPLAALKRMAKRVKDGSCSIHEPARSVLVEPAHKYPSVNEKLNWANGSELSLASVAM